MVKIVKDKRNVSWHMMKTMNVLLGDAVMISETRPLSRK